MTTEAQPHATIAQVRQNMVSNCQWAVAHHNQFTYALSEEMVAQPITFLRLMPGGAVPQQGGPNPYCPLDVDGDFGPETTKALQWKLGVDQDGDFGPDTKKALQRHLGVDPDGDVGPDTIKALQRRVGVTQSGVWGAETTKGLQRELNANTF